MTTVDRWAAMVTDPHPAANCGPLMFDLPPGHMCPTCGTVVFPASLHDSPVQGPAGAPFRPGDRFRMVSGNGLVVRTGTILQWDVPYSNTRSGHWYVEVDPLPRPPGARVRKHNPWDGFRTWFDADQLERVP